jgi:hypothetical protein
MSTAEFTLRCSRSVSDVAENVRFATEALLSMVAGAAVDRDDQIQDSTLLYSVTTKSGVSASTSRSAEWVAAAEELPEVDPVPWKRSTSAIPRKGADSTAVVVRIDIPEDEDVDDLERSAPSCAVIGSPEDDCRDSLPSVSYSYAVGGGDGDAFLLAGRSGGAVLPPDPADAYGAKSVHSSSRSDLGVGDSATAAPLTLAIQPPPTPHNKCAHEEVKRGAPAAHRRSRWEEEEEEETESDDDREAIRPTLRCTRCGVDIPPSEAAGYVDVGGRRAVLAQLAETIRQRRTAELLKRRRLSLVIDLDETMEHAIHGACMKSYEGNGPVPLEVEDVGDDVQRTCIVLRAFSRQFVREASKLYDVSVFSLGNRIHVQNVMGVLDRDLRIPRSRISCRQDMATVRSARRKQILPHMGSRYMTAILDDREDVWGDAADNVLRIARFEGDKFDGDLHNASLVLAELHRRYYFERDSAAAYGVPGIVPDVAEIMATMRLEVLSGTRIMFCASKEGAVHLRAYAELAVRFGASVVSIDASDDSEGEDGTWRSDASSYKGWDEASGGREVTHVVVLTTGPGQRVVVDQMPATARVVYPAWLTRSCERWVKYDERPWAFPLPP